MISFVIFLLAAAALGGFLIGRRGQARAIAEAHKAGQRATLRYLASPNAIADLDRTAEQLAAQRRPGAEG